MKQQPTVLVAVDIEGVAGVWRPEQTQAGNGDYERARRWMTLEADAAVRGAFAGGAGTVLVNDSHGHFGNLLADEIDPRAQLIQGKPRQLGMMAGVDQQVDGVLMIGWHARAKAPGVLAHTTNSFAFARVWLNGLEVGEIGLYAALAGQFGAPVLMVSGCDVTAAEAAALMPQVACTVVKWSEGARSGRSMSPPSSRTLIEAAAKEAVQRLASDAPAPLQLPGGEGRIALRLQCQTPALADAFALWPTVRREATDTLTMDCATVHEAVRCLNALSLMGNALR
ncbi:MAG: M55 family metallopeptidase [Aquincola tertiaricarbonis]